MIFFFFYKGKFPTTQFKPTQPYSYQVSCLVIYVIPFLCTYFNTSSFMQQPDMIHQLLRKAQVLFFGITIWKGQPGSTYTSVPSISMKYLKTMKCSSVQLSVWNCYLCDMLFSLHNAMLISLCLKAFLLMLLNVSGPLHFVGCQLEGHCESAKTISLAEMIFLVYT